MSGIFSQPVNMCKSFILPHGDIGGRFQAKNDV